MTTLPIVPLALATLLSVHGYRKKSLSPSGAAAAFVVGLLMMSGGTIVFGVALIGFYLTGSRATKYGKKRKAQLEDGFHEAGYRTGWQVMCNSAAAFVAAFVWNVLFFPSGPQGMLAGLLNVNVAGALGLRKGSIPTYDSKTWCPTDGAVADGWSRALLHFACCLGDTLASELGILSRSQPRLITTFRPVPPGTNGAMSVGGTIASVVGGLIVGALVGGTLVLENAACGVGVLVETVGWGMAAGGIGSLVSDTTITGMESDTDTKYYDAVID
ncbi:integral membrane family protein [Crucibulum laeve]|uniref:Integral membrane family protein n=1 Tax=Crucibulum laeve TaxID=68775 RepID=A0A5C3LTY2_9AGAR|nr:integral membrane family protein [Crucibulum laeve]